MSLKYINYILEIGENLFSKDNLVDRKPHDKEKIIAEDAIFICVDKWQNLNTYADKKFQDMFVKSTEIVVGQILPSLYKEFLEQPNLFFLNVLLDNLEKVGWKKLDDEQARVFNLWRRKAKKAKKGNESS